MSRVLVTLANVHKAYGRVVALNDLSLDIVEGEFLTILGPSGSGKTTTSCPSPASGAASARAVEGGAWRRVPPISSTRCCRGYRCTSGS